MASLPSRERELKLSRYTEEKIKSESLPSRERELKRPRDRYLRSHHYVAPLAGA